MNKTILLLRLEGPLQSWGARSHWDVRDTSAEPTKSGVVGLIGCALGYPTGDPRLETELDAGLRFGVRVEAPGRILKDFQTVTGYLPTAAGGYRHSGVAVGTSLERIRANPDASPATILSPRFYLEDAAFLVGLEETGRAPSDLLMRCANALQSPRWPLFLGRKACLPTRPVFEALTGDYQGLEDALRKHPWSWLKAKAASRGPRHLQRQVGGGEVHLDAYIEDSAGPLVRQDAVRTNSARQYGFRNARRLAEPGILLRDVLAKEAGS
jgi:CRISPR system Cascade subunit CasD